MTNCPACGELFDPVAHQQSDGYARCPNCGQQSIPDLEEVPGEEASLTPVTEAGAGFLPPSGPPDLQAR